MQATLTKWCSLFFMALWSFAAAGHGGLMQEVVVLGKKPKAVGDRVSANEGVITASDLDQFHISRPGDMLEIVPGLVASQHSGSGKANQYFLRGFNLDHGTDFLTQVDFVPVNMVSHGHGQGYTDLNFVIPELVDSIDYRKGPYYADSGDFSGTGRASFHTARFLPSNLLSLQLGSFGYRRGLLANQWERGLGVWLLGAELQTYDGPWTNVDEDTAKKNLWLKYSSGGTQDGFDLSLMLYRNRWNAADQIPARILAGDSALRFSVVDPSSGGESNRYSASLQKRWHSEHSAWLVSAYGVRYGLDLWSNFTYYTKPEGDQILQADGRWVAGGDLANTRDTEFFGRRWSYTWGLNIRFDDIDKLGLFNTRQRSVTGTVREDAVNQQTAALYWTGATEWGPLWTTTFNVRWNAHRFSVDPLGAGAAASLDINGGHKTSSLFTGAIRSRYAASDNSDFYFNIGRAYHSNDARGVLAKVEPDSGQAVTPARPLVPVVGAEAGANWQSATKHWTTSVALWVLQVSSESVFVGDAGTTEDTGVKSQRTGFEWTGNYHFGADWQVGWDYAYTHSELRDATLEDKAIPGALQQVTRMTAHKSWAGRWQASAKARLINRYHLGAGRYAREAHKFDLSARYFGANGVTWQVDVLNLLDARENDIEYWYDSQLLSESEPVSDYHIHPLVPRTLRLEVSYEY